MKCAKVYPSLGALALGGLEPEEAVEVRRHLALCSGCRSELEELEKIARVLEAAPPPAEPLGHLKGEILARVRGEKEEESASGKGSSTSSDKGSSFPKKFRFALPAVAAAALVAVVTLGVFSGLRAEFPVTTVQLVPTPALSEELRAEGEEYWGVADLHPQPSGSQLVELKLNNLEEPGPRDSYELWFVSGENYVSAGSFKTAGSGESRVWLTAPPEARNYRTLLVTEEPEEGNTAPGQEEILRGEVP